ncbi:MAG: 50S ribosomal protein L15 [Nevskiaceae bacterium]|nr:MAG: 50S ribosomal protein L15 [Nevskiaceae bacterium]
MKLNTIKPAKGAKTARFRVARGIGSGMGKTAGRGHKGQRARKGGRGKLGFEGGQMPIQRRLPKRGFNSAIARTTAEINLSDLNKMKATEIDLAVLKAENVIRHDMLSVKLIKSGSITRKVVLKGIPATKGAREAVTAAGGSVGE